MKSVMIGTRLSGQICSIEQLSTEALREYIFYSSIIYYLILGYLSQNQLYSISYQS